MVHNEHEIKFKVLTDAIFKFLETAISFRNIVDIVYMLTCLRVCFSFQFDRNVRTVFSCLLLTLMKLSTLQVTRAAMMTIVALRVYN